MQSTMSINEIKDLILITDHLGGHGQSSKVSHAAGQYLGLGLPSGIKVYLYITLKYKSKTRDPWQYFPTKFLI